MDRSIRAALACGLAVALAACSSGGGSSNGGGPAGAEADARAGVTAMVDAMFERWIGCGLMAGADRAWFDAEMAAWVGDSAAAVAAGRMAFSRARAEDCVAAIAAETCAEAEYALFGGAEMPAPCAEALVGAVVNGSACRDDQECATGYCAFDSACPGRCAPFTAVSASCSGSECGPGRVCAQISGTSGFLCYVQTAPGADGQPCSNGFPSCALGNYCDVAGTCRSKIALGAACPGSLLDRPCVAGTICYDGRCRVLARAGEGCADAVCNSGSFCAPSTLTCVAWPTAGQDCTVAGGCGDGSNCRGLTTRTCIPLPATGEDCTATDRCRDGSACVGAARKTCVLLTVGRDCAALAGGSGTCSDGSWCIGATTKRCTFGTAAPGAACDGYRGPATDPARLCAPPEWADALVSCERDAATASFRCVPKIDSCY
jgi:hypothetical protein